MDNLDLLVDASGLITKDVGDLVGVSYDELPQVGNDLLRKPCLSNFKKRLSLRKNCPTQLDYSRRVNASAAAQTKLADHVMEGFSREELLQDWNHRLSTPC